MSIPDAMEEQSVEHPNTPESSPNSSDSESPFSEPETILRTVNEPDVSLDEMLSLACRQGKLDIVQLLLQSGAQVNERNKAGNTPLLEACSQGHVAVANYLLEHGSKIDTPTETTLDSALTWACTLGNSIIVDALLHKNADVEHRTKDGCTALMFACLAGHRDVAEKLLDANSEVNVESDSNKDSPLTFACWKGHYDVVELLLKRNANIEHRTKEGFSPLMFAALGGHTTVARKLLENNAQVNVSSGSNNDIPLTSACWKGHRNVVKLLLEFNSNIEHRTKDGCTPLMLAAREGHISVAELLLMSQAQVNVPSGSENNIPLTLACWKGHGEVVKLLLEYGSDIEHRNKAGCTPLMLAAREGHLKTTRLLLTHNAQVNVPSGSNDDTPLTLACWKGHKDVVLLLLQSHSNVDHQTKTGCTPLMEATREGHKEVAEILLNHNADVELPDNYGQSPLFMACWKGHRNVAELLLNRFAYRDCRTKTGITPLFQACRENHVAIVDLLLEHGAGVNAPFPNSRENPLTLCAEKGHKVLVEMLLDKGASHDCRTKKGCTPMFLAAKEGHLEIVELLASTGANLETPDARGNSPIMAAYKNGHVQVVEWLIKVVHHLPSDELCHKILMSTVEEKEKELIVQRRSKCLNIIQETKRKRELLALKNAQNLVQELDDEKSREEQKKTKRKEKRRDKRNKRKKNRNDESSNPNVVILENGHHHDDDEPDEEDTKDHLVPTENRQNDDDFPTFPTSSNDVLKISHIPTFPINIDLATTKEVPRRSRKKSEKHRSKEKRSSKVTEQSNLKHFDEKPPITPIDLNSPEAISTSNTLKRLSPINVVNFLASELSANSIQKPNTTVGYQLPKTPGVCTQSTSTLGPSRSHHNQHRHPPLSPVKNTSTNIEKQNDNIASTLPVVSSVAVTTSQVITTSQTDPRTDVRNITPTPMLEIPDDDDEFEKRSEKLSSLSRSDSYSANSTSSVSRNNSFDEYKETDWKEISRSPKLLVFELIVPNGYCGRVIGKAGKKINMITEESGAQITIDKPPANAVPADRVITIKGVPKCVEKARYLVTSALNTPSLHNKGNEVMTSEYENKLTTAVQSYPIVTITNTKPRPLSQSEPLKKVRVPQTKSLPSAEVSVTPLVTYRQVATGAVSLENIQKQQQSRPPELPITSSGEFPSKESPHEIISIAATTTISENASSQYSSGITLTTGSEFSYFTQNEQKNEAESIRQIVQRKSLHSVTDLPNRSSLRSLSTSSQIFDENANTYDRSRSVSLSTNTKIDKNSGTSNSRSMSTDAIHIGDNFKTSDAVHFGDTFVNHIDTDIHVFTSDDNVWSGHLKSDVINSTNTDRWDTTTLVNTEKWDMANPPNTEKWEISSSPTSSVSSSKVELANILNDNDSGMGGSNPLGPTPVSEQNNSRISLHEAAYLETALDNSSWLQNRGAYSAPSSPALQRNVSNNTLKASPKNINMRSQLSMENLNYNRAWAQKPTYNEHSSWNARKITPPSSYKKLLDSPENHDSAVSSPRSTIDRALSSPRPPLESTSKTSSLEKEHILTTNPAKTWPVENSKPWSAERFQDVHTIADLLSQLSLDKYSTKLQEAGVTLETVISLTEKDLQAFEVPKGPRLKILKACEVIKSQKFVKDQLISNNFYPPLQSRSYSQQPQQTEKLSKQSAFSSSLQFPELTHGGYPIQPPSYNIIYPNAQHFIYPSSYQQSNFTHSLYQQTAESFASPQVNINQIQQNQSSVQPHPTYVYQENPAACYFYSAPQ